MIAAARKAWVSAAMSGTLAAAFTAQQMELTVVDPDEAIHLVLAFVVAALASGGVTYVTPNKRPPAR